MNRADLGRLYDTLERLKDVKTEAMGRSLSDRPFNRERVSRLGEGIRAIEGMMVILAQDYEECSF